MPSGKVRLSHFLRYEVPGVGRTGKIGVTFCGRPVFRVYNDILRAHNYESDIGKVMSISNMPTCALCAKHVKGKINGK